MSEGGFDNMGWDQSSINRDAYMVTLVDRVEKKQPVTFKDVLAIIDAEVADRSEMDRNPGASFLSAQEIAHRIRDGENLRPEERGPLSVYFRAYADYLRQERHDIRAAGVATLLLNIATTAAPPQPQQQ